MSDMMKDIYTLELHESCSVANYVTVFRVAGGWIYKFGNDKVRVFVPFNKEFILQSFIKKEKS